MDDILVEIKSNLPESDGKQYAVTTVENNTVAGLIRKLCRENGIVMKTSYTLRDKKEKLLQWSQTLANCGVGHGDILYLCNEEEEYYQNHCTWNSWWFVAAISLLIGGVGITAITILFTRNGQTQYQYGVVFDAGSSHTSMYVYKWDGDPEYTTAVARQIHECRLAGDGLTSYENNTSALGGPMAVCLKEAENHVPFESRKTTPVFLGATAGMRMLNEVNPDAAVIILNAVEEIIKSKSTFSFKEARIITGAEEGTFGWITANYVAGNFGVTPSFGVEELEDTLRGNGTVGALDMGGASTQITFYTPEYHNVPDDYRKDMMLYGQNYSVYTHSYLCYGINEAIRQYQSILVKAQGYNETNITNPCGPEGNIIVVSYSEVFEAPCARYVPLLQALQPSKGEDVVANYMFIGTGNETECASTVHQIFNFSIPCPKQPCTFNGTYQPHVFGNFYAFSSFYYEMEFLNLTLKKADKSLANFKSDLSKLCNSPWSVVKTMPAGNNGSMLGWYCFEGHYIRTLLVDAYKFDNQSWNNINFVKKIKNTDVGWTLGYMLYASNNIAALGPRDYISTAAFSTLTVLFAIFVLLSVAFGCHARKYQQQRVKGLYEQVPTYGAV